MRKKREKKLELAGLTLAPSQVWGSVRLVPLLRAEPRSDLRLHRRQLDPGIIGVALEGDPRQADTAYFSYLPHALVLEVEGKGATVCHGTRIVRGDDTRKLASGHARLMHRLAKSEGPGSLRFLPLHLAMEGYLALHFSGPEIMWPEYSRRAISQGLSPRYETMYSGAALWDLDGALRTFEVHETQCGVLLFVADAFAGALVVPQPSGYRGLHRSLIEDMYTELLVRYSAVSPEVQRLRLELDESAVASLDDVERLLNEATRDLSRYEGALAGGLFDRPVTCEEIYRIGPFVLERFRSDMTLGEENYIGERIVDAGGGVQYFKVLRLSDAQARRAFLLMKLHAHEWNLEWTAAAMHITVASFIERLESAGFGYLLRNHLRPGVR